MAAKLGAICPWYSLMDLLLGGQANVILLYHMDSSAAKAHKVPADGEDVFTSEEEADHDGGEEEHDEQHDSVREKEYQINDKEYEDEGRGMDDEMYIRVGFGDATLKCNPDFVPNSERPGHTGTFSNYFLTLEFHGYCNKVEKSGNEEEEEDENDDVNNTRGGVGC
ncbi:hypothetical protein BDK51DRAFT_41154 [Blyttiomyces helicus]|uniref:Uncharacterized protein n=1 Tax=Blyttiomyces helicus TaxID=388810 RepID=A0A4P9WJA3_9FUNG|nr:hypothetical protein BDK51DRAFT_41154 [Blyttiomyces helicus]|eukprot:RKO92442.1 hypothetical protein BDK51DRAFT_41154 [Blyttiomyces helicus]